MVMVSKRVRVGQARWVGAVRHGVVSASAVFAAAHLMASTGTTSVDVADWVARMTQAPVKTTFQGVYIDQHGNQVQTSRITHLMDGHADHGKLESLDGTPREVLWSGEKLECYQPASKSKRLDRVQNRQFFPSLLSGPVDRIMEGYVVSLGDRDRVAGVECQTVVFEPRDHNRFRYQFCSDMQSGLILKAQIMNEQQAVLRHYLFTQVSLGAPVLPSQVKPSWPNLDWMEEPMSDQTDIDTGWKVSKLPAGFRKLREFKRPSPQTGGSMVHLLFSDGIARFSVFVEPRPENMAKTNFERRVQSAGESYYSFLTQDAQITVVGEVPGDAAAQIAHSVQHHD